MLQDSINLVSGASAKGFVVEAGTAFPASPADGQRFRLTAATSTYVAGDYYYDQAAAEWTNALVALSKATGFTAGAKKGAAPTVNIPATPVVPYDLGIQILGKPDASAVVARFVAPRAFEIPAAMTGSIAKAATVGTGAVVLSVRKNGVEFGTVTFAAGAASGTFAAAAKASFAIGDIFTVVAPATADATFGDAQATFVATVV
jgi:hypothetical protein